MINTVTGPIKMEEFGRALCHEHFFFDLGRIRHIEESTFTDLDEVAAEAGHLKDHGIDAVLDMTTIDMDRDVVKLKELSERLDLKIVAATGFYLSEYHPDWLHEASADDIAELFIRELQEGVGDTGIRCGVIGEIASSPDGFVGDEKKCLLAAAKAAVATGAAVSTHTGRKTAFDTVETLVSNGVRPDKIIIGHQDLIDDTDYHLELLGQGVNIAFDTCGKKAWMPDETRAANALKIIRAGYGDHLLLSNDVSRKSYLIAQGGLGYTAAMASVIPKLREIGASEEEIDRLLKNPGRIVDIA